MTVWLWRLFLPLGPGNGAWVQARVARAPLGPGPNSFRTSPPPPARIDSPGDFHSLPQLCSSQMLRAPRGEPTVSLVARRWCGFGSAAEAGIYTTTPPKSSGNIEAGHLAGRRGVPQPHL